VRFETSSKRRAAYRVALRFKLILTSSLGIIFTDRLQLRADFEEFL